jgi:hypothetical protein
MTPYYKGAMDRWGLDAEQAFIYSWQTYQYGPFTNALFEAMSLADNDELMALSMGFPMEVAAFVKYLKDPGYWEEIERVTSEPKSKETES